MALFSLELIAPVFVVFPLLFQSSSANLNALLPTTPSNLPKDTCPAGTFPPAAPTLNDSDTSLIDLLAYALTITNTSVTPDGFVPTCGICKNYGYICEEHIVTTEDGYNLTMHRIPKSKNGTLASNGPVLIQHGLFSECTHWMYLRERSLPFLLADQGYDVWLGNFRGNAYSRTHKTLKTTDSAFWEFSWHEIGIFDIPAMIDYILKVNTDYSKLHYIGHSMGTTAALVMLSQKPEYNAKISLLTLLAPVCYCTHMTTPIRLLALLLGLPYVGPSLEFFPQDIFIYVKLAWARFCGASEPTSLVCKFVLFLIMGFDSDQIEKERLQDIMSRMPSSTSLRCMDHYFQEMNCLVEPCFQQLDFGPVNNTLKYKRLTPPPYDLSKVTCPTQLFYGNNDWLASKKDVLLCASRLPNIVANGIICIDWEKWNHVDFLWAKDAPVLLYKLIIEKLLRYPLF